MTRYRRVRYRRTKASDLKMPRPYLNDGTPIKRWRALSHGCVEVEQLDGTRRTVTSTRFTMAIGAYIPQL